jgi:hypothetical protein
MSVLGLSLGFLLATVPSAFAAIATKYKPHDPVFVVANKVGPFNNPSETYEVTVLLNVVQNPQVHANELIVVLPLTFFSML